MFPRIPTAHILRIGTLVAVIILMFHFWYVLPVMIALALVPVGVEIIIWMIK